MRKTDAFRRAAALMAALSITVSLAAPAFAGTYYIDDGDITITKNADGSQTIKQQGKEDCTDQVGDETVITTRDQTITTQESDLEGPAAEDSGFGPVVEDNYQPAPPAQPEDAEQPEGADQPEDAEEPEGADQPKDAEEPEGADQPENTDRQEDADQPKDTDQPESAGQQAQPQQAAPAPAAAPAASTPQNDKGNGFWGNTITVINNFANTVLNLTLKDVKIDVSDTGDYYDGVDGKAALSVQGDGNVTIELDGDNVLKSGYDKAGLEKNASEAEGTLTLKDDNKEAGSLTAKGGESAAGIGGSYNGYHKNNGTKNIIITGGTVEATGGGCAAGIGGGSDGGGKNITISGGTVTAAGGNYGAGIGGGDYGSGEDITINGGTVTATGGFRGAGIGGGGDGGGGKNITINSGTVNATGGEDGAGIGGGHEGSGEIITINGGTVNATGGEDGAGIGGGSGGYRSGGKNITIKGGTVNAAGGNGSAGIGGGLGGSGENITINGGAVDAKGGNQGAGIGGGVSSSGENITISGGTVTAAGGYFAAGIGGGSGGSGSNVTVSGAAQVTAVAGKGQTNHYYPYNKIDSGATIGNGSRVMSDALVNGEEIQADISGLMTTGYIHHIIYNEDGSVKQEWREFGHLQPAPAEESNEVDLGTPLLHVETLEGSPLPFNARRQGSTLRVTTDTLSARLYGTRQALEAMREQGVEQIQFVTTLKTTTLPVAELLAEGGSWFALEHNGLVSRRLSAAQAESLKCQMR